MFEIYLVQLVITLDSDFIIYVSLMNKTIILSSLANHELLVYLN